jgi:hypothetical protein
MTHTNQTALDLDLDKLKTRRMFTSSFFDGLDRELALVTADRALLDEKADALLGVEHLDDRGVYKVAILPAAEYDALIELARRAQPSTEPASAAGAGSEQAAELPYVEGWSLPRDLVTAHAEIQKLRHAYAERVLLHEQAIAAPSSSASEQDERAGFEAHIHTMDVPSDALDRWPDGRYLQDAIEGCWSGWQARAAHQAATNPANPMDWPIPCDVKVGGCTIRKGCKLSTLVTRMESLHRMAMKAIPKPTPEARAMVDAMIAGTWDGTEPPTQAAPEAPASAQPVAAAPAARQIMFAAYSRCIVDDRLSPDQIADVLLSAAPAAPVAQATTASARDQAKAAHVTWRDKKDGRAPAPSREAAPLHTALENLLRRYVGLVVSGDAGNWDAETEDEVIAARAALAQQGASQDAAANAGGRGTPTDLSHRLRETADQQPGWKPLLTAAADEIERYYGGMLAWKQTAEKKDRDWNAERTARVDDRIAARAAHQAATNPVSSDALRVVVEEAASVFESAAKHNTSKGRTVFAHEQQDRANRLRAAIAATTAKSPSGAKAGAERGEDA